MKTILIIANNDIGLYKFRKELVEALLEKCSVHIALPYGEFVDDFIKMGCVFHATEFNRHGTNPLGDLSLFRNYMRLLSDVKPNIVFTYTIKPNIYGGLACSLKKVPYIANITGLGSAVENKGLLQVITTTLYRIGLKKARKVFFQNSNNMSFMKDRNIVGDNFDLLPGSGVNLKQYQPAPYPDDEIVRFLFVARIMKEKGIDQFLETAKYIRKRYPNTEFHICGFCEEDYQKQLQSLQDAGIITYHGSVKDMAPYYGMTSCTVHPTYYPEGMSNVLLESCASARPIITTDRAGCREIVDDGVNGYICKQKDTEDLIRQVENFLSLPNDRRKLMGVNGRLKIEREFNRQIVVDKYIAEIDKYG